MPRSYARKTKSVNVATILEAIKQIKIDNISIRAAATSFQVPKSNLARYIATFEKAKIDVATADVNVMKSLLMECSTSGPKPIFNPEQEAALIKYLLKASDINYGLGLKELRTLAYEYAKKIGILYPNSWDENHEASSDWQITFMKRHKNLSLRTPQQTSQKRAKAFCKENVDAFFANLLTNAKFFCQIFNPEQEAVLIKYLLKASDINYGLSLKELRTLAYEYAKKIGISYPNSWDENHEASSDWQITFMKRHKNLSLRTPQQTSQKRAKAFCKENVDAFFANLSSVLNATQFEAHRIWNMDETACPTVPSKPVKIIARRKHVVSSTTAERGTHVSLALAVSATGQSIPPFYIFPRKNWKDSYITHAGHGSIGRANKSGYMTSDEFPIFMRHFIKHTGANSAVPTLLLLDNFVAHLTIEAIDLALDHGITMLSFPPHCTHRMQPLDVAVFSSFKAMFSEKHDAWKKTNVGVLLDLHHVPLITDQCLDAMLTPKIIKSGFRATGIFPFNAQIFTEVDFTASKLSDENLYSDDNDDVDDSDTQRRIIVSGDDILTAENEEVSTSEASTSSLVSAKQLQEALKSVGPLKKGTPAKKSNRGPRLMKSNILTSPEVVSGIRDKAQKKRQKLTKKSEAPAAKKKKQNIPCPTDTDVGEDLAFCIICKKNMPKKENHHNTAYCTVCDRGVHIGCAGPNPNTYTCVHCDSE